MIARFQNALLLTLLVVGCTLQTLPTVPTISPTVVMPSPKILISPSKVSTNAQPVVPTQTTSPDLIANVRMVVAAIEANQPEMLRSLIGEEGVAVGGFAQELIFKGHNNADEIVAAFTDALSHSTPSCEGFVPNAGSLPDKAILVYRGFKFDWSRFGLSGSSSDGMTLQLFELPEGWRLVYITPFNFESDSSILVPLQDCPSIR